MKKHLFYLLIAVAVFAVVVSGCSKKVAKPEPVVEKVEEPAPPPPPAPEPEPEPVKIPLTFLNVNFDYDKSDLRADALEILGQHAKKLMDNVNVKIQIEGHCDERGTVEYNLALGERRANAVKNFLVNYGVAADRISTISYGKERPLDPASNEEAWAKNRRAAFVVVAE